MANLTSKLTGARALGVAALAGLGLSACATSYDEEFAGINSRLDQLDARVQAASQNAEAANQSAQTAAGEARTANQRLDSLEDRVNALETAPVRQPRG